MTKDQYHLLNTLRWHARNLLEGTDFPWSNDYPIDRGRVDKVASNVLSKCLQWLAKKPDSGETACLFDSYLLAGRVKLLQSDFTAAEGHFRKGLELSEQMERIDLLTVAELKQNLGAALDFQNRESEALEFLESALDTMERVDPVPVESVANLSNNLGLIHRNRNDFEKAEEHYLRAREIFESLGESSLAELSLVFNNLGTLYWAADELDAARGEHEKAFEIRSRILPANSSDVAQSASNLAVIFHQKEDFTRAEELYKQAIAALDENISDDPGLYDTIIKNYGALLEARGEAEKATVLFEDADKKRSQQAVEAGSG